MGNDSEKAQGLNRVEEKETNSQTQANSTEAAFTRKPGPAYGGSTKGNPTSSGKISR